MQYISLNIAKLLPNFKEDVKFNYMHFSLDISKICVNLINQNVVSSQTQTFL